MDSPIIPCPLVDQPSAHHYNVYILRCAKNGLYIGATSNVERRFAQHCAGKGGAHYTQSHPPLAVVWVLRDIPTWDLALRIEKRLKLWLREEKERLILGDVPLQQRVERWLGIHHPYQRPSRPDRRSLLGRQP